jgi:peptidoglycan/LPS O-acetylase OafA/YrhL
VFDHSFGVLAQSEPFPRLQWVDWGAVGVIIFFSISGFLVTRSWVHDPRLLAFASKRALRLFPGLVVALLLTAFVLGPLVTIIPIHSYLEDPATKTYVLSNATLQINYALPGVFAHNIYPGAVNGSLWTLPVEVKAYAILAVLGLLGVFKRWRWALPLIAAGAVLACIPAIQSSVSIATRFNAFVADIQMSPIVMQQAKSGAFTAGMLILAAFAVAATLYGLRAFVVLRWDLAALAVVALVVAGLIGGMVPSIATVILAPYLVLCLAYLTHSYVSLPRRIGDYSYGLYIFAFPVQQTISQTLSPASGWTMFVLSMAITTVIAAASWHFIERPALGIKQRIAGGEPPAGPAVGSIVAT